MSPLIQKTNPQEVGVSVVKPLDHCDRCHGTFVPTWLVDPFWGEEIPALKCMSCGKHEYPDKKDVPEDRHWRWDEW